MERKAHESNRGLWDPGLQKIVRRWTPPAQSGDSRYKNKKKWRARRTWMDSFGRTWKRSARGGDEEVNEAFHKARRKLRYRETARRTFEMIGNGRGRRCSWIGCFSSL